VGEKEGKERKNIRKRKGGKFINITDEMVIEEASMKKGLSARGKCLSKRGKGKKGDEHELFEGRALGLRG